MADPASIYPVMSFDQPFFVAFDRGFAEQICRKTNDDWKCDVTEIQELPLVDNFGFPCSRNEAGFLFPWLGDVDANLIERFRSGPDYVTIAERDAADLADDIAYWQGRLS